MENELGTKNMKMLVLTNGIPLMLSLLVSNLYNFVDSVFVSHVAEKALTALSLASPIQVLMSALGIANAVGLNAVISRALGEKDNKKVKRTAQASIWLAIAFCILLAGLSFVILKPYFISQANGDMEIVNYGMNYLSIVMFCSLGVMGQWVFDRFTIASGKSKLFLITLSSGALTNIILDPIFIFGYFGLPAMGITGAAIATVIGQHVGALMGIIINRKYNPDIPISFSLVPDFHCVFDICRIGIPSGVSQAMLSVMGVYVNSILIPFSSTAVAVFGACTKIQSLAMVPIWGFNNGIVPIVAYNYGANKLDRCEDSIKWTLIYEFGIYIVILAILEIFPTHILYLFDASNQMLAIGIPALRVLSISYLISIPCLCLAADFQGFGEGIIAMVLTLLRQTAFLFVFLFIFKQFQNVDLIWWAYVGAEIVALPIGMILYRKIINKVKIELCQKI